MITTPLAEQTKADRLSGFDFERHNNDVREVWKAVNARQPAWRIPILMGANTRYFMFDKEANPGGLDFREYSEDPDVMYGAQLQFQRWTKFNLLQDTELGLPEKWVLGPDFQNYY